MYVLQCFVLGFFFSLSNGSGLNSEASACSPTPLRLPQTSGGPLWFTALMWTWLNLSSEENRHIFRARSLILSLHNPRPLLFSLYISIPSSNIDISCYLLLLVPSRPQHVFPPLVIHFPSVPAELLSIQSWSFSSFLFFLNKTSTSVLFFYHPLYFNLLKQLLS